MRNQTAKLIGKFCNMNNYSKRRYRRIKKLYNNYSHTMKFNFKMYIEDQISGRNDRWTPSKKYS